MFENSVHYKLRKRKKQWIVVGISVVSGLAFTFSLSITQSFAAENDSTTTPENALVEKSETPVTSDVVKSDQSAATNQVIVTPEKVTTTEPVTATTTEVPTDTNTKSSVAESTPVTDSAPKASEITPVATTNPKVTTLQVETQTEQNETALATINAYNAQTQPVANTQSSVNTSEANAVKNSTSQPSAADQTVTTQAATSDVTPIQTNVNGTNNKAEVPTASPVSASNVEQAPSTEMIQPINMNLAASVPVVASQAPVATADSTIVTPTANQTPAVELSSNKAVVTEARTASQTNAVEYRQDFKQVTESGKVLNETWLSAMGDLGPNQFYDVDQIIKVADFLDNLPKPITGYTLSSLKAIEDGRVVRFTQDPDQAKEIVEQLQTNAEDWRNSSHMWVKLTNFEYSFFYKPIDYLVTFDSNGGSKIGPATFTIENGIDQFVAPTRAGYTFGGWQEGNNLITRIQTGTIGDKMLQAIWNPVTYQVKFDADGGSPVADQSYTINDGITSFSPTTRTGYTFSGWLDQNGNLVKSIPAGQFGDQDFKAKWTPIVYQVKFDADGGSPVADQSYTINDGITSFSPTTRAGYAFSGWTDQNGTVVKSISTGQSGNQNLKAKWAPIVYHVAFDSDGGSTVVPVAFTIDKEVKQLPTPTKDNYRFEGWYDKGGKKVSAIPTGTMNDVALAAHWAKIATNSNKLGDKNDNSSNSAKNDLTNASSDKKTDPISLNSDQASQSVEKNSTDDKTPAKPVTDKWMSPVKNSVTKLATPKAVAEKPTMSSVQGNQNLSETTNQNAMAQPMESTNTKVMSIPTSNMAANQSTYPKTGEKENHLGFLGMALTTIAGILGIAVTRKKSETEK